MFYSRGVKLIWPGTKLVHRPEEFVGLAPRARLGPKTPPPPLYDRSSTHGTCSGQSGPSTCAVQVLDRLQLVLGLVRGQLMDNIPPIPTACQIQCILWPVWDHTPHGSFLGTYAAHSTHPRLGDAGATCNWCPGLARVGAEAAGFNMVEERGRGFRTGPNMGVACSMGPRANAMHSTCPDPSAHSQCTRASIGSQMMWLHRTNLAHRQCLWQPLLYLRQTECEPQQ